MPSQTPQTPSESLSNQVRQAVKDSGLTTAEVSRRSGLSLKTAYKFVEGRGGSLGTVEKVVSGLGLEVVLTHRPPTT